MIPHAHTHAIAVCAAVWGWCTAPTLLPGSAGYDMAMCPNHIILNNARRRAKTTPGNPEQLAPQGQQFRERSALTSEVLPGAVNKERVRLPSGLSVLAT